jgi:glycogen debranching enzyme
MPKPVVTKNKTAVRWLVVAFLAVTSSAHAQTTADSVLRGMPRFKLGYSGLSASGGARAGAFLGDIGSRAALIGEETGAIDVWIWPDQLVSELRLVFKTPAQPDAIEASTVATTASARPEAATVVYEHPVFTVRQHLFVPLDEPGALILLEVESRQPLEIQVRMRADFHLTWVADQRRFLVARDKTEPFHALIGSPFATSGASRASAGTSPAELVLRVEPVTAQTHFIPIIIAAGDSASAVYRRLVSNAPLYWAQKVTHYQRLQDEVLSLETPDKRIDQAFEWSKVNLDQRLSCIDRHCGLSGAASIHSIGMSAVGNFEAVRRTLAWLASQQRDDGSMAGGIAPEDTPLWLRAYFQYWNASGDDDALEQHWPNLVRAFRWAAATDANDDGLMENAAAGAGITGVPAARDSLLTDIHLAGVWVAALEGLQQMARAAKDNRTLKDAAELAARAQRTLEEAFWKDATGIYGSALRHPDETAAAQTPRSDAALTVWPVTPISFGLLDAERSDRMLTALGSSAITADWGARMLSSRDPRYDSLHYSNGVVSPFMTGFAALAHYQQHRAWAAFELVRALARAHFDFAAGRPPELLSGASYRVLAWALPNQLLGSAMFVAPVVRGLIGWEVNAPHHAAALEPHLPADWATLRVSNLPIGADRIEAAIAREAGIYTINLRRLTQGEPISLRIAPALPLGARLERVVVNDADVPVHAEETAHDHHGVAEVQLLRDAQIEFHYTGGLAVIMTPEDVAVGASSPELRVLDFRRDGREYVVVLEGTAGSTHTLHLHAEARVRAAHGSDRFEQSGARVEAQITMPAGEGFVRKTVRVRI